MKKQTLLVLSGGLLALASCNNGAAPMGGGMSQAQVDSAVNAKVDAMRTELTRQNDSLINTMATMKADSMIVAMKGGAPVPEHKAKPVKHSTTGEKSVQTPPPPPVNPKDARFNGTESKHDKAGRFNQDAAKQEATDKKADRFK